MQSILASRCKYPNYRANPPSRKPSIDESANGLTGEEREKKLQEIEQKKKENDPHYVTWESKDDPANPQNW